MCRPAWDDGEDVILHYMLQQGVLYCTLVFIFSSAV